MTGNEREIDWNYNKLAAAAVATAATATTTAVTTSIAATAAAVTAAQYKCCFLALFL